MFKKILDDYNFYKTRLQIRNHVKAILLLFLFNPGFQLTLSIRLQSALARIPLIGSLLRRFVWYGTSIWTGSDVSFQAKFAGPIYFPHPTGVVIGDTWDIGARVTIMQGVTLGRKHSHKAPNKRSTVGNDVMISCGAKLIGELDIGNESNIGANAVVLTDVPEGSTAVGVPAKIRLGK
jgi:serine O-acetyltransferase